MNILEELYFGNIRPNANANYSKNSPLAELDRLCEKNRENLLKTLNESEKETFEKFTDTQSEIDGIVHYQKFTYGFKLGVLIVAEAFANGELKTAFFS